ncbi:hypothetical protein HZH68_004152 [Vespula germanica]|uniref:Uncharacterized protein n=1 Tax=Vespula germanica TaxID=30212 RepID=A0A834KTC8_VESGE|nr:hypothetical protein HZH68_004152 [Vespula germanica]
MYAGETDILLAGFEPATYGCPISINQLQSTALPTELSKAYDFRVQEPSPLENMEPSIQADTNQPSDPVDEEPVKVTRGKVVQSESLQNQEFLENKRFSSDRSNPNQSSYR